MWMADEYFHKGVMLIKLSKRHAMKHGPGLEAWESHHTNVIKT